MRSSVLPSEDAPSVGAQLLMPGSEASPQHEGEEARSSWRPRARGSSLLVQMVPEGHLCTQWEYTGPGEPTEATVNREKERGEWGEWDKD